MKQKNANKKNKPSLLKNWILSGLAGGIVVVIGYYQYIYEQSLKWKDIRYSEAKVTYDTLLKKTANLVKISQDSESDIQDFSVKLDDYFEFLRSDFALYHGDFIFIRAYSLGFIFTQCIEEKKKNSNSKCESLPIDGRQYRLGICARTSLDHIRKTVDPSIIFSYEQMIKESVNWQHESDTQRDCGRG
ncbi:hypothetical protein G3444_06980 [Shewanella baltica]|uniref:Uncharacterized protein n=1 Tax=Shewanella baltica (strain OS195) TaxID=399599 RepID=A9KWT5_SHEB9|nr:hypothetical protein [Shewanella baltica]ABX50272.1 hypothetical protein Sbal195_3110 [Shewanella baltica OS195]ADT95259.1 hypothetical protein Sbal678_3115 [Shewanella baltica OS678]MCS6118654.1 hypothetical protein [Shewanella baltica]